MNDIEEQSSIALLSEYDITNEKLKLLLLKRELIRLELISRLPNLEQYDEFKPKKLVLEKSDDGGVNE